MSEQVLPPIMSDDEVNELLSKASSGATSGVDKKAELYEKFKKIARAPVDRQRMEGWHVLQEVELPGGIVTPEGRIIRDVVLKSVTGELDLVIEGGGGKGPMAERILEPCVFSIGGSEDRNFIHRCIREYILSSDFMYLMLRLREVSLETQYRYEVSCDKCGHKDSYDCWSEDLYHYMPEVPTIDARQVLSVLSYGGKKVEMSWHWCRQADARWLRDFTEALNRRSDERAQKRKRIKSEDQGVDQVDLLSAAILMRLDSVKGPDGVLYKLSRRHATVACDGEKELSNLDAATFVKDLPYALRLALFEEIKDKEPDQTLDFNFACKSCGNGLSAVAYPLDAMSWRPEVRSYKPEENPVAE